MQPTPNYTRPLAFIGLMFFAIGFGIGTNGLLVPIIKQSLGVTDTLSYLLYAATFIPFLIFPYPASRLIARIGYKRTMAVANLIFTTAFATFAFSAYTAGHDATLSLVLCFLATFIAGGANATLQAAVNPYITILGPIDQAAKRISIMGICNKLSWPLPTVFIVGILWFAGINLPLASLRMEHLIIPFVVLAILFSAIAILAIFAPLPEVEAEGESTNSTAPTTHRLSHFPHLWLGCIALFLYVGAEVMSLATLTDYATTLGLAHATSYSWIGPIGITIGYLLGIALIPRYLSQVIALRICALTALIGTALTLFLPPSLSIYALAIVALGCSLMWPAIWPLAMSDLGSYTKTGASVLTMANIGGALLPLLFGACKESIGMQYAYSLCLLCFGFIAYYAFYGYRLRRSQ